MTRIKFKLFKVLPHPLTMIGLHLLLNFIVIAFILNQKNWKIEEILVFAICVIFFEIGGFVFIKRIVLKTPIIRFDSDVFFLNRTKYYKDDIEDITLSGKFEYVKVSKFALHESRYREGLEIRMKNGETITLFDEFYKDLGQFRKFLKENEIWIDESRKVNISEIIPFRSNQFFSLRGLFLWLVLAFTIWYLSDLWPGFSTSIKLLVIILAAVFFSYQSRLMNYFIINGQALVAKKENIPWLGTTVNLNEVREVVFDYYTTPPFKTRRVKQLRLVLNDFTQKTFPASTLTRKDWKKLESFFLKAGFKVRNEFN